MRRGEKPTKPKVEAKLPVAGKSRKNEGSRVRDLEKRLTEALEQQTATAEVLRVIASSPTDLQKVLDSIAMLAARLTESESANVQQAFGEYLRSVARFGISVQAIAGMDATGLPGPRLSPRTMSERTFPRTAEHPCARCGIGHPPLRREKQIGYPGHPGKWPILMVGRQALEPWTR